jgi:5-methyltetrahydrofolate--homocysteine methyltransferase
VIKAANENQAHMIGLSGLITPSLDEMVTVASEMQRAGMTMPLLIGGATTSKVHTALRIDPAYEGPVLHVLDASRAVGVASSLVSDTQKEPLVEKTAADYQQVRDTRAGKGQNELSPLGEARANAFAYDPSGKPPAPLRPGLHKFGDWPLRDLRSVIDWTPFFRAWELAGNYPAILEDEVVGESARSLFKDAQAMLDRIIAEHWLTPRGTVGLWRCKREGDDVLVYSSPSALGEWDHAQHGGGVAGEARRLSTAAPPPSLRDGPPPRAELGEEFVRLPFLRQQVKKREGRPNMCLADFIDPDGEDWIGGFTVGIHGLEPHLERFKVAHDDYSDILLKALSDRLAEAFAEVLHAHVRNSIWGYADEHLTNQELIRETYAGIRPAPGYPACPDHSLKPILFDMLGGEPSGVTLTENFAMLPTSAVSGFYFAHRDSDYFGVARIGPDQLDDYAARRGVTREQAERWLRPNLD